MANKPVQNSLFEEDYLLRELGQLGSQPQLALTELVANAWDAGASKVALVLPSAIGDVLTVTDDGHGITPEEFKIRWMTLGYDRIRHQGVNVEISKGSQETTAQSLWSQWYRATRAAVFREGLSSRDVAGWDARDLHGWNVIWFESFRLAAHDHWKEKKQRYPPVSWSGAQAPQS